MTNLELLKRVPVFNENMKGVHIKRLSAGKKDVALANQLFHVFLKADKDQRKPPGSTYLKKVLSDKHFYVLVAIKDGEVVGGITAFLLRMYKDEANELFLFEIEVQKEFRRQNIRKGLVKALRHHVKKQNAQKMFVLSNVKNRAAMRFYRSLNASIEIGSRLLYFT